MQNLDRIMMRKKSEMNKTDKNISFATDKTLLSKKNKFYVLQQSSKILPSLPKTILIQQNQHKKSLLKTAI